MHARVSLPLGHACPPYAAEVVIWRVRVCAPSAPPSLQPLLHVPHPVHDDIVQSTGQECPLHALLCVSAPQDVPPHAGWVVTERVRLCEPLPQLLVHWSYAVQSAMMHATGQHCVLHARISLRLGHAVPPY